MQRPRLPLGYERPSDVGSTRHAAPFPVPPTHDTGTESISATLSAVEEPVVHDRSRFPAADESGIPIAFEEARGSWASGNATRIFGGLSSVPRTRALGLAHTGRPRSGREGLSARGMASGGAQPSISSRPCRNASTA